jgi:hypothetical protein
VKIWSRRGADFTHCFPTIAEAVRGLAADEALIDGEAVVLKDDGWSDFAALMTKRRGAGLARGLRPSASRRRRSAPAPAAARQPEGSCPVQTWLGKFAKGLKKPSESEDHMLRRSHLAAALVACAAAFIRSVALAEETVLG